MTKRIEAKKPKTNDKSATNRKFLKSAFLQNESKLVQTHLIGEKGWCLTAESSDS